MTEDRYEAIELIVKCREDGTTWFDIISDMITETCEGEPDIEDSCTCGMQTMGGMTGTLEQCFEWSNNVSANISPIMIARVIDFLSNPQTATYVAPEERTKIIDWAHKEIEFEEYFENKEWENDEENDE